MDKIIATNLKKLREASGYTQEEIAGALGIKRSAYSNYESGEREVPFDILESVADFYGCEMAILFEANEHIDEMIMASAFRIDGLAGNDAAEIMRFKDIVKSYLKMESIEAK